MTTHTVSTAQPVSKMTHTLDRSSPLHHFVAGWVGASLSCAALSPLEVIKTRLQSSMAAENRLSPMRLAKDILRAEGVLGFYRGLLPHLLGVGPSRALYFGAYNYGKRILGTGNGTQPGYGLHGTSLHLSAAGVASIFSATLMSPVWVVKTRLQLQQTPFESLESRWNRLTAFVRRGGAPVVGHASSAVAPALDLPALQPATRAAVAAAHGGHIPYNGIADAFVRIYREEGVSAFYRGLGASYLGVVETAVQFALYGALKERIVAQREEAVRTAIANGEKPGGLGPGASQADIRRVAYTDTLSFTTSATAKLLAAVATYPHEVLRTRLREQRGTGGEARYRGVWHAMRAIYATEGVAGLYGGMSVHLLRTVPNAAILLMVVEKMVGGEV